MALEPISLLGGGGPHTHVFSADSMKLPEKIGKKAAGSFLK
jgi:hypothetical protein